MSTIGHESDDRLELYALGRLPDSDVADVEEHLLFCEHCRRKLDEAGTFAQTIREELTKAPARRQETFSDWFRWVTPQIAMAGALAIVLLASVAYWQSSRTKLAPLATLQLIALRGEMQSVQVSREIDLTVTDAPESGGPFRFEVVDGRGAKVWTGSPTISAKGLEAKVQKQLAPGDYFARLYGENGELLHEYGFRVRG